MSVTFDLNATEVEQVLIQDSYTKLASVLFPIEAARASVVMHYEEPVNTPTLVFMCNAYIHQKRITPPAALRINGVATRKYAIVPCAEYSDQEVTEVVDQLNLLGYYAYTVTVNGKVKIYICWDEQCQGGASEAGDDGSGGMY